ncbi:MAG: helix-turn-helix transcriptional regulator [Leptolyngbyaceae cyanobacterium SM2_5_2]|nr:helix-turn-helix transcriptional regulator [Leptolyngbyaceae cyanobacterium SM2_5_2]
MLGHDFVMVTFQDDGLRQLLREQTQRTQPHLLANALDQTLVYPDWLGAGHKRDIELPSSISLTFHQYHLHRDVTNCCAPDESDWVEFVFSLSSRYFYNENQHLEPQRAYLAPPQERGGQWRELAQQAYLSVDIHLELSRLNALVGNCDEPLPPALADVLNGGNRHHPILSLPVTPAIETTVRQMLQCSYRGLTQSLYLEAKSLELLALFIDACQEGAPQPAPLSRDDRDRIHHAQQIILNHLQTPPSLIDLARQVGLNDRKLKEGFREIFGTTVFGYLTQQRLDRACQLLAQQYSIAAVAAAVGYASATAFSGAFRRRYGVSPKAYQIGQRFGT